MNSLQSGWLYFWIYLYTTVAATGSKVIYWFWQVLSRFNELLRNKDIEPAEVFAGGGATTWGLVLMAPADTFGTSPSFRDLRNAAPEEFWGALLFCVGIWVLASMFLNKWIDTRKSRSCATLVCFMLWTFILYLFSKSNFYSTATGIYPWLALAAAWAHLRLGRKE